MTNPFTRVAIAEFDHGPGKATDNLTSLGDDEAKHLGQVDFSAEVFHDAVVAPVRIKTGAVNWAAGDTCSLYLIASEDGSTGVWTDGWVEATNTDQAALIETMTLVETIATEVNATSYYFDEFSIQDILGYMPTYWALVMKNNAVAAAADLSSTAADHYAKYSAIKYV